MPKNARRCRSAFSACTGVFGSGFLGIPQIGYSQCQAWTSTEGVISSERLTKQSFFANISADLNIVNVSTFLDPDVLRETVNAEIDLVIIDEAHHIPAQGWRSILEKFPSKTAFLLFTATPTNKGQNIHEVESQLQLNLFHPFSHREAVASGAIRQVDYRSKEPGMQDSLDSAF
jgi:superfamily II DNA or RNA helicase